MPEYPLSTRPALRGEVVDEAPAASPIIQFLELISFLMDRAFTFPGTNRRFGLNSLMLLAPIVGELLAAFISFSIVAIGLSHYRVPRIVAVRMVLNSLLDAAVSWIPLVGNIWDVTFKADSRNVRLLKEAIGRPGEPLPATWHHWLFVAGLIALLALFLALFVVLLVLAAQWLFSATPAE